jgi:hypothetical protein
MLPLKLVFREKSVKFPVEYTLEGYRDDGMVYKDVEVFTKMTE